jgi:hypothetical protein
MNINVHIERIILDGVPVEPGEHRRLKTIVATELTRQLVSNGLSSELLAGRCLPTVKAGMIQLRSDKNSAQLGQRIATALYDGIGMKEGLLGSSQPKL